VGACTGRDLPTDKPAGYGRSECTAADVEGVGRSSPSNVAKPGAKNTIPGIDNMDSILKELLEGVAQAES
jgi:hypothetical protein